MAKKTFVQATTIKTEVADGAAKIAVAIKVQSETSEFADGFKQQLELAVKDQIEQFELQAIAAGKKEGR